MKKLFTLFLTLFVASSVWAVSFNYNGLYYSTIIDGGFEVAVSYDYENDFTDITIPSSVTYDGQTYSVTSISAQGFYYRAELTSITIPNSVTSIGDHAFEGCTNLISISIPESVTSFGRNIFWDCYNLTSITIKGNVDFSALDLYFRKDGIRYHILNKNSVEVVCDVDEEYYYASIPYSGDIILPSTITAGNTYAVVGINGSAFRGCTNLTSITIPNSVTSIGEGAFRGCTGLTSITIPENMDVSDAEIHFMKEGFVYKILNKKEVGIDNLYHEKDIDHPEYLSGSITIPSSVVFGNNTYTVTALLSLYESPNLVSLAVPNTITYFDEYSFESTTGLKEYIGPADAFNTKDPLTYTGEYSTIFEKITITKGMLTRDGLDFINFSYRTLKEIDLSGSENTEIPDMAFNNCYKLEKVTLPSQLESVGYKSFAGCTALKGISLPATVTKIDNSAFEDCRKLEQILFDGSELKASTSNLETIGDWAFYNCHNLKSLEIPEGVTSIGDAAFYGCSYLQDLQLPSTLKSLGDNTFALCENLKSMTILAENPPSLYEKSFYNVDHTIPVSVPESSLKSYAETEYWKEFIHLKSTDGAGGETTSINGVSNATTVTIENNQILVNGEAPAFVVTVSGKKIANQNLKSGVYFVNVEGETVKVSVQ